MKLVLHSLIVVGILFSSCRKKDFPETISDPVGTFYFTGTIDGSPVALKAGLNNYYMYSGYTGADTFYTYTADLKLKDCNTCTSALQIKINDNKIHQPGEQYLLDSVLSIKTYPIRGYNYYKVKFKSNSNQSANSYRWEFGDGTSSSEADPEHLFGSAGNYSVNLKINTDYGCQQYISNIERIFDSTSFCRISSTNPGGSTKTIAFSTNFVNTAFSFIWDFGDGHSSNLPQPSHTYAIAGTYPVKVKVIRGAGDTIYARRNVATLTSPMPCLTNYNIASFTALSMPLLFSKATINWTDELGELYTSDSDFAQPGEAHFKIVSIEDFDKNEKGQPTKKIKVNFSCNVYNGSKVKRITNAEAVIGVAYK